MSAMDGATIQLWEDHVNRPSVETRRRLLEHYLPVARRVAHYRSRSAAHDLLDAEDYLSYGVIGLIGAFDAFDPNRQEASFTTFAYPRIDGAIIDAVRELGSMSRRDVAHLRDIHAAWSSLAQELARIPTAAELQVRVGMSADEYGQFMVRSRASYADSLDEMLERLYGETEASIELLIALADTAPRPDEAVLGAMATADEMKQLGILVRNLRPNLRFFVEQYFYAGRTLADIAAELGVTESNMSHVKRKAVRALRLARLDAIARYPDA